jgi:DNA-binding transcriptional LysR family regulator
MFDLRQLRCFVAVAEELHFGRAACRLNMSQPPLSRQIQTLERILDVALLERTSRSVALTFAGRNFLPEARRILELVKSAVRSAKRTDTGETGPAHVVSTAATTYQYLPSLMTRPQEAMPTVNFGLSEMVSADQVDGLAAGRADIGLMRPFVERPNLQPVCVSSEDLVAAFPEWHPLAAKEQIEIEDFEDEPFVTYDPKESPYLHDKIAGIFSDAGVTPNYVQYMTKVHAVLSFVQFKYGCALVPESTASFQCPGIVFRPLATPQPIALHGVAPGARQPGRRSAPELSLVAGERARTA